MINIEPRRTRRSQVAGHSQFKLLFSSLLIVTVVALIYAVTFLGTSDDANVFSAYKFLNSQPSGYQPTCPSPDYSQYDDVSDNPPPIEPSLFASVYGLEPFQQPGLKSWSLHTIPTDDWYDRAKVATDRCDLELHEQIQSGHRGLSDEVVWVSSLLDLKRGDANMGDFRRGMDEYYARFQRILDRGFKMVIFIPKEFEEKLRIDYSRIKVIHMYFDDLPKIFPYNDRLQAIRTSQLWQQQAVDSGWLMNAPQAKLPGYNPLVMSKVYLLRDAARANYWGARYHLWMDAGHFCAVEQNPTQTSVFREHMSRGFLVTHWPYGTATEVHGFLDKAMHLYLGTANDPLRIVRGGVFGGTLPQIECVAKAYTISLHQTLADGYLGTEECIWAIIYGRLPHLFAGFDNNSLGNHGDNCAIFQKNIMDEQLVTQKKMAAFKSPEIPKFPSWWTQEEISIYEKSRIDFPNPDSVVTYDDLRAHNLKVYNNMLKF